ncbi:MAG TPA: uridine kinase [bacterium]|nr:uridine kinase [bacterium]HXK94721.1 uridine kinase [bacterium]
MDLFPAFPLTPPARAIPLIGVVGPSASGKSTLVQAFLASLAWPASHLSLDFYYRDLSYLPLHERARINFDCPTALEIDLVINHLSQLAAGRPVLAPVYDFRTHTRIGTQVIQPKQLVVVEGLLLLAIDSLRPFFNLAVYLDTPADLCLLRRIHRDMEERNRTLNEITNQYVSTVRPMMEHYVLPSKSYADLILDGRRPVAGLVEELRQAVGPLLRAFQEKQAGGGEREENKNVTPPPSGKPPTPSQ